MQRIQTLLRLLNESDVRYLVIGATAFAAHGWVRATADLDLFIDDDLSNVGRLRDTLSSFGYDVTDASVEDFRKYKILLRQYDLPLDVHPHVKGVAGFAGCWDRRVVADLDGVSVPFASLDDLIAMKRAADRPRDRDDLQKLEELKKARDGSNRPDE
jgi:predicted nucleotidyltransferase